MTTVSRRRFAFAKRRSWDVSVSHTQAGHSKLDLCPPNRCETLSFDCPKLQGLFNKKIKRFARCLAASLKRIKILRLDCVCILIIYAECMGCVSRGMPHNNSCIDKGSKGCHCNRKWKNGTTNLRLRKHFNFNKNILNFVCQRLRLPRTLRAQ